MRRHLIQANTLLFPLPVQNISSLLVLVPRTRKICLINMLKNHLFFCKMKTQQLGYSIPSLVILKKFLNLLSLPGVL